MKQTILLAAASKAKLIPLLEMTEGMLHSYFQRYYKVYYLEQLFKKKQAMAGFSDDDGLNDLVSQVENEMRVEKYAREKCYSIDILKNMEDDAAIITQSSVADLLVIDLSDEDDKGMHHLISKTVELSSCPVLLLPEVVNIECIVATHDASQKTVKMMKGFIKLFGDQLKDLPLSLLMTDPSNELEIQRERVFINYLKLYFNNIGAQHMYDDTLHSLFQYVQNECEHPLLMINEELGAEIIDNAQMLEVQVLKHPIFIFKD